MYTTSLRSRWHFHTFFSSLLFLLPVRISSEISCLSFYAHIHICVYAHIFADVCIRITIEIILKCILTSCSVNTVHDFEVERRFTLSIDKWKTMLCFSVCSFANIQSELWAHFSWANLWLLNIIIMKCHRTTKTIFKTSLFYY